MKALFLHLCGFSVITSIAIVIAIALRPLLKKGPSFVRCIIWALLFLRLMLPFTLVEAPYSMPKALDVTGNVTAWTEKLTASDTAQEVPSDTVTHKPVTESPTDSVAPPVVDKAPTYDTQKETADKKIDYVKMLSVIWVVVGTGLFGYMLVSHLRLRYKVRNGIVYDSRVRIIGIDCSPFVMGIINPTIYIPATIDQKEWKHIIAHETSHIKRLDHILKPLAFAVLCLYWFNPLVWAAYLLLSKDIEYACDERTVKAMAGEEKKAYSFALLSVSRSTPKVFAPLSFGKVNVKERIKRVMGYKKSIWALCLALTVCVTLTAVVACTPSSDKTPESKEESTLSEEESLSSKEEESAASEEESSAVTPTEPYFFVGYVTPEEIPEGALFYDDADKDIKAEHIEIRFEKAVKDFKFISIQLNEAAEYCVDETLWNVEELAAGTPFYAKTYIWEGFSGRGVSFVEDGRTVYASIMYNTLDGGISLTPFTPDSSVKDDPSEESTVSEPDDSSEEVVGVSVNLAQGKKYTITDDPTSVDRPPLFYGDDDSFADNACTKLTDGVVGDYSADCYKTEPCAMPDVTVMMVGTSRTVEIIVDLGAVYENLEKVVLRGVRMGTDNGNGRNIELRQAYVRDDSEMDGPYERVTGTKSYTLVKNAPEVASGDGSSFNKEHYDYVFTFDKPVSGRRVRLVIGSGNAYIRQLEEIEVWGR